MFSKGPIPSSEQQRWVYQMFALLPICLHPTCSLPPFLGLAPQDIYDHSLNPVLKAIHQLKQAFNFLNTRSTVIYLTSPLCLLPRLLFLRPACPRKAGDLGPPNIPHAGGQHSYPSPSPEHPTTPESARLAHSQHLGPAYRRNKENIHLLLCRTSQAWRWE
jgi:hypothetical protein